MMDISAGLPIARITLVESKDNQKCRTRYQNSDGVRVEDIVIPFPLLIRNYDESVIDKIDCDGDQSRKYAPIDSRAVENEEELPSKSRTIVGNHCEGVRS